MKLQAYARTGVPEYIVIDPELEMLRHYRLKKPGAYHSPDEYDVGDSVSFDLAPSISVPIAELFEGSPNKILWSDPFDRHM